MKKQNKKSFPQSKKRGKVIVKCKCKCEEDRERMFLVKVQYINQKGN